MKKVKKAPTTYAEWLDAEGKLCAEPDDCQFCLGQKGGVPGNENIIGGITVCDYCTALVSTVLANRKKEQEALEATDAKWDGELLRG